MFNFVFVIRYSFLVKSLPTSKLNEVSGSTKPGSTATGNIKAFILSSFCTLGKKSVLFPKIWTVMLSTVMTFLIKVKGQHQGGCIQLNNARGRMKGCVHGRGYIPLLLQFSSVAQSCPTLCDPKNRSTPGFPVHHQLPKFTQTYAL